jgi:Zn ribbon nucleic-acid-binding protein
MWSRKGVEMLICKKCGYHNREENKYCVNCGYPLEGALEEVKTGTTIQFLEKPATDENLEELIRLMLIDARQRVEKAESQKGIIKIIPQFPSEEELRKLAFDSRKDLRELLNIEPTILQVRERMNQYIKTQQTSENIKILIYLLLLMTAFLIIYSVVFLFYFF